MGAGIPEAAGVGGDLVGQHDGAVAQAAELQLEVHQIHVDLLEEVLHQFVGPEGQRLDGVDLLAGGQLQGQGVVLVD